MLGEAPMMPAVSQLAAICHHLVAFVEAHGHGVAAALRWWSGQEVLLFSKLPEMLILLKSDSLTPHLTARVYF